MFLCLQSSVVFNDHTLDSHSNDNGGPVSAETTLNLRGLFSMPVSAVFRMAHSNVLPTLVLVSFEYHLLLLNKTAFHANTESVIDAY